jgi:hypothetical protein
VVEGKSGRVDKGEGDASQQQPRRRSSRASFRAEEGAAPSVEIPTEGGPVESAPSGEPVAAQG